MRRLRDGIVYALLTIGLYAALMALAVTLLLVVGGTGR